MAEGIPANTFCWNELLTSDAGRCATFYGELFGWTAQTGPVGNVTYTVFKQGERDVCGMLQMSGECGGMKPHWMSYVSVEDVDASARRVTELGGQVCVPPTDIPVGRFAVIQDPAGGVFSLIQLALMPPAGDQ